MGRSLDIMGGLSNLSKELLTGLTGRDHAWILAGLERDDRPSPPKSCRNWRITSRS